MQANKSQVKKFVELSLDEQGLVSAQRVRVILECIRGLKWSFLRKKTFLKAYGQAIARTQMRSHLHIAYTGPCSEQLFTSLEHSFTQKAGRALTMTHGTDSSLIAGVRVTLGDTVWENSVAARLAQFTNLI